MMASLRYLLILTLKSNPRDLWPLRHLIRVIRRHNLTQKYLPMYLHTYQPTYLPTYQPTYPPTYLPDHSLSHFWFLTLKSNPGDLWPLRQLIRVMRRHDMTKKDLPTSALWIVCGNGRSQLRHKMMLETCDIWYTYYNSDNWEPEFMTIFVIWP